MNRRAAAVLGSALAALLVCCGYARLPHPPYVRQTTSSLVEVPYPPPPARVEFVPPQPRDEAVWIDGEWVWRGRRWSWRRGRWVIPAPGTAFSPRTWVRDHAGTLFVAEGRWRDRKTGAEAPAPKVLLLSKASPGEVVDPEGDNVDTGPNVLPGGLDGGDAEPSDAAVTPDSE